MTTSRSLYPHGRASALAASGTHSGEPDYDLVARLHPIRAGGDEVMTAVEQYAPNFSLKLVACTDAAEAETLLTLWLQRGVNALTRTQEELRLACQHGHTS